MSVSDITFRSYFAPAEPSGATRGTIVTTSNAVGAKLV